MPHRKKRRFSFSKVKPLSNTYIPSKQRDSLDEVNKESNEKLDALKERLVSDLEKVDSENPDIPDYHFELILFDEDIIEDLSIVEKVEKEMRFPEYESTSEMVKHNWITKGKLEMILFCYHNYPVNSNPHHMQWRCFRGTSIKAKINHPDLQADFAFLNQHFFGNEFSDEELFAFFKCFIEKEQNQTITYHCNRIMDFFTYIKKTIIPEFIPNSDRTFIFEDIDYRGIYNLDVENRTFFIGDPAEAKSPKIEEK